MSSPRRRLYLIGFHGQMGVGKNYIAENLLPMCIDHRKYRIFYLSFAHQVKMECLRKTPQLSNRDYHQKPLEFRRHLQTYATEERAKDPDTWIRTVDLEIDTIYRRYTVRIHV